MGRGPLVSSDTGLSPHPWVSIEVAAGEVTVDGVPLAVSGTLEDRYLAALQHVATNIATPLDRQVGVTVRDGAGLVSHLAISPEGQAIAIEDLVRDARVATATAAEAATGTEATEAAPTPVGVASKVAPAAQVTGGGGFGRRRLWWVAAATLAVLGGVLTATAFSAADDGSDPERSTSPGPTPSVPTATVTERAVVAKWHKPKGGLVAEAFSPRRGVLRVQIGTTRAPARVVVTVTSSAGQTVSRRVTVRPGIQMIQFTGLSGGEATWTATAKQMQPVTGTVRVRGPLPAATSQPSYPAPSQAPASGGGAGKPPRNTGPGEVPPTAPIDPDDQ